MDRFWENEIIHRVHKTPHYSADHALVGTWTNDEEDPDAVFAFSTRNNKFRVSGFCRSDGEEFEITQVRWDGEALGFNAGMPSTDNVTKNVLRIRADGKLDRELTTYDIRKKKDVKPGEIPEAWRRVSGRPTPHTKIRRGPSSRKG